MAKSLTRKVAGHPLPAMRVPHSKVEPAFNDLARLYDDLAEERAGDVSVIRDRLEAILEIAGAIPTREGESPRSRLHRTLAVARRGR